MWLAEITAEEPTLAPIPIAEEFHARRRAKWKDGRAERGLTDADPFQGDPAIENQFEALDMANYTEVDVRRGRISAEEWEWALPKILELYAFFRAVEQR